MTERGEDILRSSELRQYNEYTTFVKDFSARINWDIIFSFSEEQADIWYQKIDKVLFQTLYLQGCAYELFQGEILPLQQMQERKNHLISFAFEMSENNFLLDEPDDYDLENTFTTTSLYERNKMQSHLNKLLQKTDIQIQEYATLAKQFGVSEVMNGNNVYVKKIFGGQSKSLMNAILISKGNDAKIFVNPYALEKGFSKDFWFSKIGFDSRCITAVLYNLEEFNLQRQIAGEASITDDNTNVIRQAIIENSVAKGRSVPPVISTDVDLSNLSEFEPIISLNEMYEIMTLLIPARALEGVEEVIHNAGEKRRDIIPWIQVINTLSHYQQAHTTSHKEIKVVAPSHTKDDYKEARSVTVGTNSIVKEPKKKQPQRDTVGRRVRRTKVTVDNQFWAETAMPLADKILLRSRFIEALLHELGEHMLKTIFTVDDMREWKNLTQGEVLPLTRYVINHSKRVEGRPEMEAFCEGVGMLYENAYLVHVVAPDYLDFIVKFIAKNMPENDKGEFVRYIINQLMKSKTYWESQGYTDEQVRDAYLKGIGYI